MKIVTILPLKESLIKNKAGAVSIFCTDTKKYSKFKKNNIIISSDPYEKKSFFSNKKYISKILNNNFFSEKDLYEIHNRPEYVKFIRSYYPNAKITLTFHNDPLELRGSVSKAERIDLYNQCNKIIFISYWIQKRFFSEIKDYNLGNAKVIYHGVKKIKKYPLKKNNILFVGKLNESKGYHIFVKAAEQIKKEFKNWNVLAIGTETRKNIFPDKRFIHEVGQLSNDKVLKYYKESQISVSNSTWNEPLGRAPMESSSMFCLPISSNIAGLKESKDISIVLKNNNYEELYKQLKFFIENKKNLKKKQILFNKKNKFDIKKTSLQIDLIRSEILDQPKERTKNNYNQIKVLHIADFNEESDGRLYYSFSNKLNYGAIKLGLQVHNISEKNYVKSLYKSNLLPLSNMKFYDFNYKILKTIKNFKPDILLLGHVFSVTGEVFNYCKLNNIKICRWYIDSISPEFFDNKKIKQFFSDEQYIDKYFFTSNPKILTKYTSKNKLNYIPNPTDDTIDYLKNFENNNLDHDMFVAISHGQNRALLKKGKYDSREKIINYIIKNIPNLKVSEFGMNTFEPIWGDNFYKYLSKCKMALNISRGKYTDLYSSDRIASLAGNGLLIFVEEKSNFKQFFKKNEMVFYKDKKDLLKKIKYFLKNDKIRKRYAKNCYKKYHNEFSSTKVISFIINQLGFKINTYKKPLWFKSYK